MPVTTLDPRTALIVVDLQKGIVGLPTAHPGATVVAQACALVDAFRRHGLPIVFVTVDGRAPGRAEHTMNLGQLPPDWTELVPELDARPEDHRVTKKTWGAFTGTDLDAYLKAQGVTQVVVGGIATTAGVESTARHAHELGFHVTLAVDAMTDMSREATGTVAEIIAQLDSRGG
jgi:nicotinamidase-related amidase